MSESKAKILKEKQSVWLFECIERNEKTEYGMRYGFKDIHTIEDYQREVPLVEYEDISSFITRIAEGEDDILFKGEPIAFEVTGGSSSGGKLIPYTQEGLKDFQQAILPWFMQTAKNYKVNFKESYWSISPALRDKEKTTRGIDIGVSDAAYLGDGAGSALAGGMIPQWVSELSDLHEWQLATLYWLICSAKLELISVWSPTFLLMLMEAMKEQQEILQGFLRNGGVIGGNHIEQNEEALERFNTYIQNRDTAFLWPDLKLISCWSDAMSKPFSKQVIELFPHIAHQPKGLISTESVVTMPNCEGYPLLSFQSGFYEFLDAQENIYLSNSLVDGEVYEVVITTNSGLYRYRSGDMMRYEGLRDDLPILRFMGRKGIVSDMVGEKFNELFIQQALEDVEGFNMIVAQPQSSTKYLLLGEDDTIKNFVDSVEEKLMKNPQYAYARKIGQLKKLEAVVVENGMMHYIEYKATMGSRVGDIKIPVLHTDDVWLDIVQRERK